jgi:hypothetical protein
LQRLDREIGLARQQRHSLLKIVHGYGSSGAGGDIRIAVQKRLVEMAEAGEIRGCVFGESWATSDDVVWRLVRDNPELKADSDMGKRNAGITVVLL